MACALGRQRRLFYTHCSKVGSSRSPTCIWRSGPANCSVSLGISLDWEERRVSCETTPTEHALTSRHCGPGPQHSLPNQRRFGKPKCPLPLPLPCPTAEDPPLRRRRALQSPLCPDGTRAHSSVTPKLAGRPYRSLVLKQFWLPGNSLSVETENLGQTTLKACPQFSCCHSISSSLTKY